MVIRGRFSSRLIRIRLDAGRCQAPAGNAVFIPGLFQRLVARQPGARWFSMSAGRAASQLANSCSLWIVSTAPLPSVGSSINPSPGFR